MLFSSVSLGRWAVSFDECGPALFRYSITFWSLTSARPAARAEAEAEAPRSLPSTFAASGELTRKLMNLTAGFGFFESLFTV